MRGGGIWHVILLIMLASLIAGAIQLATVFLVAWGLLFRTRQTVGLLAFCFMLDLLDSHPWAVVCLFTMLASLHLLQRQSIPSPVRNTKLLPVSTSEHTYD